MFVDGVQTVLGTGTGGAPDLDPFKADQVDLSAEYYFGEQALVSLGLFYKDVSTFIVQQQSPETYGGVNYLVNRKINGEGAEVKGVEVLVQLPFYFLPERVRWLRRDRELLLHRFEHADQGCGRPHPAVAGPVAEQRELRRLLREGTGQRRALPTTGATTIWSALSAAATGIYNSPYTDLSATVRYDFSPNVSLGLEANNLLDEKQRTYDGVDGGAAHQPVLRQNLQG